MRVTNNYLIEPDGTRHDRRYFTLNDGVITERKHRFTPHDYKKPLYERMYTHFLEFPDDHPREVADLFGAKSDTSCYTQRKLARLNLMEKGKWSGVILGMTSPTRTEPPHHSTVKERGVDELLLTEDMEACNGREDHVPNAATIEAMEEGRDIKVRMKQEEFSALVYSISQGKGKDRMEEPAYKPEYAIPKWVSAVATLIEEELGQINSGRDTQACARRLHSLADVLDRSQ